MLRAQRKEIYNRFKNFLRTYVDTRGHNLYRKLIQDMCSLNKSSFEVSVLQLEKQAHSGHVLSEHIYL
jgi:DNA replication licensing factor MCM2